MQIASSEMGGKGRDKGVSGATEGGGKKKKRNRSIHVVTKGQYFIFSYV